jgi:hypothetical protein
VNDSLSREGEGWGEGDQTTLSRIDFSNQDQWSRNNFISLTLALSLTGEGVDLD